MVNVVSNGVALCQKGAWLCKKKHIQSLAGRTFLFKAFLQCIVCKGTGLLTAESLPCVCGVGSHAVLGVGSSTCVDSKEYKRNKSLLFIAGNCFTADCFNHTMFV